MTGRKYTAEQFSEKIADADARGSKFLADANEAAERGQKELAEKLYAKGQYWLDRVNSFYERAFIPGTGKHATSCQNAEFTLCGVAYDAKETGDVEIDIVFAKTGELVTCEDCRSHIDYAKSFKRYRVPAE